MKTLLESFSSLKGCMLHKVIVSDVEDEIIFVLDDCSKYKLYEYDEGCNDVTVSITDICGDVNDLVGTPILLAEEVSNKGKKTRSHTSTWTFYKLSTIKGSVTITWYGKSNGFYSERADWKLIESDYTPEELKEIREEEYDKGYIKGKEEEKNIHLTSLEKVYLDCSNISKFLKAIPIEVLSKDIFPNSVPRCYIKELDFKCPFLNTVKFPCASTSDARYTLYSDAKVLTKCMYLDEYMILGYREPMNRCPFNVNN